VRPSVPDAARQLAEVLRSNVVPALSGFQAGNVGMTAQMLDMIAERWDNAVALLHEENTAIQRLLQVGGRTVSLGQNLRVSALEADNATLRAELITLHTEVEQREGAEARGLEAEIWAELTRSVERRRVGSANF
jgi:hypothetical protein